MMTKQEFAKRVNDAMTELLTLYRDEIDPDAKSIGADIHDLDTIVYHDVRVYGKLDFETQKVPMVYSDHKELRKEATA